ncbi:CaiB/BaiF CoA-transferase family protein [Variovorax sp. KK3]|uniref:CaiB/BaiF CoA transferase family protein n=1 Tax=Variovorax sp. KK3 TaxID=1855728 RepID=UPI00117DFA53|nr:CaiB/BaiF CoA-transferase family protein [Variovorax sp. KK3]
MSNQSNQSKPLDGVRVIDMTRLAPGPYGTMLLADLGAEVIVVGGGRAGPPVSSFSRGKKFISLDLKSEQGQLALVRLCEGADVFIEGFRPGVASRLGAGYEALSASNPRLVYCSLTGYGQTGPRAQEAGHDINYLGYTGVLGSMGPIGGPPQIPLNAIADMAGGGMLAVIGILAALQERQRTGLGQQVDAAMIDGCLSLIAMHFPAWQTPAMPARGDGWLAGAAPNYRCYRCADGGYMAVGSLEPQFFSALWRTLELGEPPDAMSHSAWPAIERTLEATFLTLPRDAWTARFEGVDACVTPVLAPDEVWRDRQVRTRVDPQRPQEVPAIPRFSRSAISPASVDLQDHSVAVLSSIGLTAADIDKASPPSQRGVQDGLAWPPRFTD